MDAMLFDKGEPPGASPGEAAAPGGRPRLRLAQRNQVEMRFLSLEEMLEPEHPVRLVWEMVSRLDYSAWLQEVKAVEGRAGRDTTDPQILLALWVFATLEGVASARRLARLCEQHVAYQWLCGGVTVNYHMLSDFRSQNPERLEKLLVQIVGTMTHQGLVRMQRVAQDGMRVRANAGKDSFRRQARLEEHLRQAQQQVEALRRLGEKSEEKANRRQRAARERAAREKQRRLEKALQNCKELAEQREKTAEVSGRKPSEARASTTDPEARTMKFANGGYGPGYNVQFSTDTESGVIVGVAVTNQGTDNAELVPMLEQLQEQHGRTPEEALVDGGFATRAAVEDAAELGCTVYAPLKEEARQLAEGKDPYMPRKADKPAVAAWRQRMGTAAAKLLYRLRGQTAEWVNAVCRNRNLQQMPVRGQEKCRGIAVWHAITHNLMQWVKLACQKVEREKLRAEAARASG